MNLPKRLIRNSDSSHCSTAFCAVCDEHLYATWDETLQTWDCVHACRGHIAGVVNPPGKPKYQYWTGAKPAGEFEDWLAKAQETKGSWWPDWLEWITAQSPKKVPARQPGDGKNKPVCDAPGEYVRVKA